MICGVGWGGGWGLVTSWEWRCSWSSADRWCSSYIWVINNLSILLPNKMHLISDVCHKNSVSAKRQNYRERSDFQLILISSPSNAAYMHQWIWSALLKIMACRLFGAKPLSKPMLGYCQLDHWEQTSVKFLSKYKTFHSWKSVWKYHLQMAAMLSRGRWVNPWINLIQCQGLYSLSGKTSYRQISWSLEAARLDVTMIVSLWNLTGISAAVLPRCLSNFRSFGKV